MGIAAAVPVPDEQRREEVKVYVVLQPGVTPEALPPAAIIDEVKGLSAENRELLEELV